MSKIVSFCTETRMGIACVALLAWVLVPVALAEPQPDAPSPVESGVSSSANYNQEMAELIQYRQPYQYPNQGGYSRQKYPSYGSSPWDHLGVEGGAGFTVPTGNTRTWQNTGYNIRFGAGWMFNQAIGLMAEYSFDGSNIPNSTLNQLDEPGGHVHIWSLTLDPIIYLHPSGRWDPYVTGGGGFYRKVTTFTQPVFVGNYCDFFYGCYPVYQNVTLAHFSSNSGGMNIGAGMAWKLSESGRAKVFAEARFVHVDSPTKGGSGTSNMIPVTFGIRW